MSYSTACFDYFVAIFWMTFSMFGPGVPVGISCSEKTTRVTHTVEFCGPCDGRRLGTYVCKQADHPCQKASNVCAVTVIQTLLCGELFDYDLDDDIDLKDFAAMQNESLRLFP